FISDIHVDDTRPDIRDAFTTFLHETVRGADALYILGDWFESWIGDDDPDPAKRAAVEAVRSLSDAGTACFFCHGNRDFLAGDRLAADAGLTLIGDEHVIALGEERVLLMHGDSLCTDDVQYMAVRAQVRDPAWQAQVLALPVDQRQALAAQARQQSKTDMATKAEDIMDVNDNAVLDAMRRHDVRRLIHGHTHRPATHRIDDDGTDRVRHVLGDWYDQGEVMVFADGALRSRRLTPAGRCES
ncbi:MAG: UDP-2,3-diacylglucosamine diphosphatase, partial [Pseudomonadota bacterium]